MGQTREEKAIRQIIGKPTTQKFVPVATNMFLPNHSGMASHPEVKNTFYTKTEVDGLDAGVLSDAEDYTDTEISGVDQSKWTRTGTTLTTKTANDGIDVDGNSTIGGNITTNTILSISKEVTGATSTGLTMTPHGSAINMNGINGYPILTTSNYSGKSIIGLNFGTFSLAQTITGSPTCMGIDVFGYGDFGSYSTLGDVYSIYVENMRLISNDISATSWTGIKICDGVGAGYFTSLPNQYGLDIDKPTSATANYQVVLQGNGDGSGIWLDGTTGERLWSDGSGTLIGGYNSTANYCKIATNGDVSFAGTAGFYPRRIRQDSPPAAGTGSTQIDTGEMLFWCDSNDSDATYLMYNDTTKGIIKIKLDP
jgi:hypothetical protein